MRHETTYTEWNPEETCNKQIKKNLDLYQKNINYVSSAVKIESVISTNRKRIEV